VPTCGAGVAFVPLADREATHKHLTLELSGGGAVRLERLVMQRTLKLSR
jgi:hypothetical protein